MRKNIVAAMALVPMIGIAAGSALAQPRGPQSGGPGGQPPRPPMARVCEDMSARGAAKLAYLQEKLQLQQNQQQAWSTFATQAKAAAEPMRKLCADMPAPPPPPAQGEARAPRPAPDASAMLGHREKLLSAQLESTKLMHAAMDAFTPSLSPEQKETFNKLAVRTMHRGHDGMRGWHRHHGPHGNHNFCGGPGHGGPDRGGPDQAPRGDRGPAR